MLSDMPVIVGHGVVDGSVDPTQARRTDVLAGKADASPHHRPWTPVSVRFRWFSVLREHSPGGAASY